MLSPSVEVWNSQRSLQWQIKYCTWVQKSASSLQLLLTRTYCRNSMNFLPMCIQWRELHTASDTSSKTAERTVEGTGILQILPGCSGLLEDWAKAAAEPREKNRELILKELGLAKACSENSHKKSYCRHPHHSASLHTSSKKKTCEELCWIFYPQ